MDTADAREIASLDEAHRIERKRKAELVLELKKQARAHLLALAEREIRTVSTACAAYSGDDLVDYFSCRNLDEAIAYNAQAVAETFDNAFDLHEMRALEADAEGRG